MVILLPFRERARWPSPFLLRKREGAPPSTYPYEIKDREGDVVILLPKIWRGDYTPSLKREGKVVSLLPFRGGERRSPPFSLERRQMPIPCAYPSERKDRAGAVVILIPF